MGAVSPRGVRRTRSGNCRSSARAASAHARLTAAAIGADDPADLPRDARGGEVAADELRWCEVDAERRLDRPVQALPDREDEHRRGEDAERSRDARPRAGCPDGEDRRGPQHSHQRQAAHAAPALDELHHGQLEEDDADGVQREDDADLLLADSGDVLRERRQQLDRQRDRGRHERGVEQRELGEDAVAEDGPPAAAEAALVQRRRADAHEYQHVADEGHAVDRKEDGEGLRVIDRGDEPGRHAAALTCFPWIPVARVVRPRSPRFANASSSGPRFPSEPRTAGSSSAPCCRPRAAR